MYTVPFLFMVLALAVYFPALNGSFIWDDVTYIVNNPILNQSGALFEIWFGRNSQDYWPLTYSAILLERMLFGDQTIYYHVVNLALHALACTMLWRILVRLGFKYPLMASVLFCVAPVNVESVAWIFQIKTLLASGLILGSTLFYLRNLDRPSKFDFSVSLALFAFANLAKISGVTWPAIILGIEWYRSGFSIEKSSLRRVAPFFTISLLLGSLNLHWYPDRGFLPAHEAIREDGLAGRLAGVGQNFLFYIYRMFFPGNFMFVYPRWSIREETFLGWIPTILLFGSALLFALTKKFRKNSVLIFCAFTFVTLFPILGFFEVSFMKFSWVSDHYLYLTLPGAILLGLRGMDWLMRKRPITLAAGCCLMAIGLGMASNFRSADYQSAEMLWKKTLEQNPTAWVAEHELGIISFRNNLLEEAESRYKRALGINEQLPETHYNLGNLYLRKKMTDEATRSFNRAIELRPRFVEAHFNLAKLNESVGRPRAAIAEYQKVLEIWPRYSEAHYDLARVLAETGTEDQAIMHYESAIESRPSFAEAHFNLALLYLKSGKRDLALREYKILEQLNVQYASSLRASVID